MNRLKRWLRALGARENRLWVTQAVTSLLAVLLALAASLAGQLLPEGLAPDIERKTLDDLLTVIASSMLAVTTFSLGAMVGAFGAAASNMTPRTRPLLMADDDTRNAIAAFLSSFIYAVVAKVALGVGFYGINGRFILFLGTLGVLCWLLFTLVKWVRTLSSLGSMGHTLEKVESVASDALAQYWRDPALGARAGLPHDGDDSALGAPIYASQTGYVQHMDMPALQACAQDADCTLHLRVRPGMLVWPGVVIARVENAAESAELADAVRDAIDFGPLRSFDQDPRFGLIVLGESGQRALASDFNDRGTAIDVMNRLLRVMIDSERADDDTGEDDCSAVRHDRLSLVPLDEAALVSDAFHPLARDGAGLIEVGIRMQKLLAALAAASRSGAVARAAKEQADRARDYALAALPHAHDRAALLAHSSPLPVE
ncbi:MAG: DUF2254 domain-containing protein [Pseudomonadota bacterium]|nr:DUF2254 domain-containing protein [Pseudomonadota bacterium]